MNGKLAITLTLAFPLAFLGCSSTEEPEKEPEATPAQRKQRVLLGCELALRRVLEDARRDAANLRANFLAKVDAAPHAFRLNTTDPILASYALEDQQARSAAIEQAQADSDARYALLFEHYEAALWTLATEAGRYEHGSDLGTRSGYQEIDDKVESAFLQLARDADVEAVDQEATLRMYEDVILERELRLEMEGTGILGLFKSAPTLGLFAPSQEGQAIAIALVREGIKPEIPLSFVHAERRRIERGGILLTATDWSLDPAATAGVVPLREGIDPKLRVATEIVIPAVDVQSREFRELRDRVLISEHRTALRRDDTGELLVTIGWQVRWNIDFRGTMRVLVDKSDLVLENDPVLPALLQSAHKE